MVSHKNKGRQGKPNHFHSQKTPEDTAGALSGQKVLHRESRLKKTGIKNPFITKENKTVESAYCHFKDTKLDLVEPGGVKVLMSTVP